MNTRSILLLTIILLHLISCNNPPYPHTMQVADTLANTYPDSAIVLLEQLKDSITTAPKATQMYYQLLTIKAKDKAYVTHTSDSLIMQVLQYYENKGDKKHLPEAYYYAGRVCRDLGDAPQALNYFQKAAELLEGSTEYYLMSKIYSQMGRLFFFQNVYEEAMKAFKKAYKYNTLAKDDKGAIINLRDVGDVFMQYNTDSALYYHQIGYERAKKLKNQWLIDLTQEALLSYYLQLGKIELAQDMLNNKKIARTEDSHLLLGYLFNESELLDSATYYNNRALKSSSIYARRAAHWGLAEIAQKRSDCKTAIEQIKLYSILTDSIKKITNTENIRKMHSLYNYQLREKQNNILAIENAKQKLWNVSILLVLAILTIIFIIYYYNAKHKRLQLQNSLRELERLKEAQKEQIISMSHKVEIERQEHELAIAKFKQSEIYNKFHIARDTKDLSDTDWLELQKAIDTAYKDFTYHIYRLYPISNIELKICLLIKADISISNIALLTGRTKSTITSARKKLYEKVHGEKGGPEMWDNLILSL